MAANNVAIVAMSVEILLTGLMRSSSWFSHFLDSTSTMENCEIHENETLHLQNRTEKRNNAFFL